MNSITKIFLIIKKYLYLCLFMLLSQNINAQDTNKTIQKLSSIQNDSLKMQLLDDISIHFDRTKADSSIYIFNQILLFGKQQKDTIVLAKSYLELGKNYLLKDQIQKAGNYLDSTQNIVVKHPELKKIYCNLLLTKGAKEYYFKNYDKSLKLFEAAFQIAKKEHFETLKMKALNNLAIGFKMINYDQQAINLYKNNLKQIDTTKYQYFYKTSLLNLAKTYYKIKKIDSSKYYQNILLKISKPQNDSLYIGAMLFLKAKIHKDNKRIDSALIYLKKAIKIYRNKQYFIFLGDIYQEQQQYYKAKKAYLTALKIYNQSERKNDIEKLYFGMGNLYQKMGKYKLAHKYLRLYKDYIGNANAIEKFYQIAEIQTKFDLATKDKQIKKQQNLLHEKKTYNKNKKRNVLLIFFLLVSILLLIFNFVNQQQTRQQINLINQEENERMRIAGDLHNSIGSHLSYIVSEINNILFVPDQNKNQIIKQVKSIKKFTTKSIAEFRDILWLLNKSTFTSADFEVRFDSYLNRISDNQNLFSYQIDNAIPSNFELNRKKTIITFRALQSSVDCIIQNAKVNNLTIKFRASSKKIIYINISEDYNMLDNIDFKNNQKLKIIKNNLSEINAKISIQNNCGTIFTFIIPYQT